MANLNIYATIKSSNFNNDVESIDVICAPGVVGLLGGVYNTLNSTYIDESSPNPPTSFYSKENAIQYYYSLNGQNIVDAVNTAYSSTFTLGNLIRNEPEVEFRLSEHEGLISSLDVLIASHYNEHEGDIGSLEASIASVAFNTNSELEIIRSAVSALDARLTALE